MLDFLLGSFFVFLFLRGWARGFVKEAMDLLGVIVGLAIAFRLSPVAGTLVSGVLGSSPTISRVIGGFLLFVLVGGGAALIAHYLHRVARLPGLALGNRLTGAGLAVAWGAFIATLVLSVVSLFRLPPALAQRIDDSSVAATLTDPAGVPQTVFAHVSGDRVLGVLLSLDDIVGARRVVIDGDERVEFDPAPTDALANDDGAVRALFEQLNDERKRAGLEPLVWSEGYARVARAHAGHMYTRGYFAHESADTGNVVNRLSRAGIGAGSAGENIALAADASDAHEGLVASAAHHANIVDPRFDNIGIAAVDGPLGVMVVQVFGG